MTKPVREVARIGEECAVLHVTAATAAMSGLAGFLAENRRRLREDPDAGYSTETVLVTALLVILAIAVIAIIVIKVTAKANSINLGLGPI